MLALQSCTPQGLIPNPIDVIALQDDPKEIDIYGPENELGRRAKDTGLAEYASELLGVLSFYSDLLVLPGVLSDPDIGVKILTAFATVSSALETMQIETRDYLTEPFGADELTSVLERAAQRAHFDHNSRLLREKLRSQTDGRGLVGQSPEVERLYRILSKVAFSSHPVLILGENGTGKEKVARAIHSNGPNASKPFALIDCSSMEPNLIESELFGDAKGSSREADRAKEGLLSKLNGGTVFLDEVGALSLDLQAKLVRALQDKEVRAVGAAAARPITARVLAATNRDLPAMVEQGKFRKDLFFRLNVVNLKVPPLRERRGDIPLLTVYILSHIERETGIRRTLSDDALKMLAEYDWPGNVRELENVIEGASILSSGPLLDICDLPTQLRKVKIQCEAEASAIKLEEAHGGNGDASTVDSEIRPIAEMEKQAILGGISKLKGDKLLAAKLLGIGKTTLYRKLKEYELETVSDTPAYSS